MIKSFKANKLISLLLIIMCIIIMFNPSFYAKSCLNALSVWTFKIVPLMFPFFIITRLIVNLSQPKANIFDRTFQKLYHTPKGSFQTFFLSALSGYPMGAKLITSMHEDKQISTNDAKNMLSFCSVSGPMFMLGTVGIAMLKSFKAGIIILVSNILASLINGLIHSNKTHQSQIQLTQKLQKKDILSDSVYDSLISILMVGSYIVLSFLIVDMLCSLKIVTIISKPISFLFHADSQIVESILCGLIEMTRGILNLSALSCSIEIKTLISSTLIAFGGLSIFMQSIGFLNKTQIPLKTLIIQKTTQAILCFVISFIFVLIF